MIKDIIDNLSSKYEILGQPIDLSWFLLNNGKTDIFNSLHSLYRPVFDSNQKILVIQPDNDLYSYPDNLASDSLIFLQECLQKIDISNWFVIVISGNTEIEKELVWLQKTHSTDSCPINHVLVDTPFTKKKPSSDTFCVNMWNHLYVSTQLEILPCCISRWDMPLGSLTNQTVGEIVNSKTANDVRLKMLSNQQCNACSTCYQQEKLGRRSRRVFDNEMFKTSIDQLKLLTREDGSLIEFLPRTIDIRLNNICNLKCRTCSGTFSSQLALEEKKLFNNTINFDKIPTSELRNKVLDSIIGYFDSVELIYFAGGEPLILKEHYDILDYLIKTDQTNVQIKYNTNFTKLNFKDKNILDYWKHFSNITVGASIDGHGRVFEYVRHGAKWEDIDRNLNSLLKECPHVNFNVTSTVGVLSVESVIELQQLWHNTKNLNLENFKIGPVIGNDYLTLQSLLPHHKNAISKKIKDHCRWLKEKNALELVKSWQELEHLMWSSDKSYVNREFAKITKARDIARGENFETTYPHFSDLFSPYY
jgi:organic radical activating enzyme